MFNMFSVLFLSVYSSLLTLICIWNWWCWVCFSIIIIVAVAVVIIISISRLCRCRAIPIWNYICVCDCVCVCVCVLKPTPTFFHRTFAYKVKWEITNFRYKLYVDPCSPVPCIIIKYIKIMNDALMMNPNIYVVFIFLFHTHSNAVYFFYIWILKYREGCRFFLYDALAGSTHSHQYSAVRAAVSVPMSFSLLSLPSQMCIHSVQCHDTHFFASSFILSLSY